MAGKRNKKGKKWEFKITKLCKETQLQLLSVHPKRRTPGRSRTDIRNAEVEVLKLSRVSGLLKEKIRDTVRNNGWIQP
jgi:hypothetical protein